jgi:hypothetical protein
MCGRISTPRLSISVDAGGEQRVPLRHKRLGAVGLRDADIADEHRGTMNLSGKMQLTLQAGDHFRNGFSGDFRVPAAGLA